MTAAVVMDASVGLALLLAEPDSGRWRSAVARWLRDGWAIVVPAHFWLEVTNPLIARHGLSGADVVEAVHALDDVVTETAEVGRATLLLAIDRAERFGLTIDDATYLALAEVLDAALATNDRALEGAAGGRLVGRETPPERLAEPTVPYATDAPVTWPDYSGAASYLASLRAGLTARRAGRGTPREADRAG